MTQTFCFGGCTSSFAGSCRFKNTYFKCICPSAPLDSRVPELLFLPSVPLLSLISRAGQPGVLSQEPVQGGCPFLYTLFPSPRSLLSVTSTLGSQNGTISLCSPALGTSKSVQDLAFAACITCVDPGTPQWGLGVAGPAKTAAAMWLR